jgi:hypothetical protein
MATTKVVIFRNIKPVPLTEVSFSILGLLDAWGKKTSLARQARLYQNDKAGRLVRPGDMGNRFMSCNSTSPRDRLT